MKIINIGDDKKDSLISVDMDSVVGGFKKAPNVVKYMFVAVLFFGFSYFMLYKSYFYYSETQRIDQLNVNMADMQTDVYAMQNVMTKQHMLLRYYNAIIKNIKLTQDVQKQRFQSIIKYLERTKSKSV